MNAALVDVILSSGETEDEQGNKYKVRSALSKEEGELIGALIENNGCSRTLEVGCAYGISSLFICGALARRSSPMHVIIDPFQNKDWHGVGVANLKKAGFHFFELIESPSEIALPSLLQQGKSFDFALIDGWHTFDHTLLDFFYVDRLLKEGGIVVIDDVGLPAVRRAVRYIANYPNYKVEGTTARIKPRIGRVLFEKVIGSMLPHAGLDDSICKPDRALGVNSEMVAFRKTGPDKRNWDWYERF